MIQARHNNGQIKPHPLYIEDLEIVTSQICEYFQVTFEQLEKISRKKPIVIYRQIAMFFCKEHDQGITLNSIGEFFGGRDHSTVIHALQTVNDYIDTDWKFKKTIEEIRNILLEKNDFRYKYFPESIMENSPEVNDNLEVLQELKPSL
jgi:hypothetical protein